MLRHCLLKLGGRGACLDAYLAGICGTIAGPRPISVAPMMVISRVPVSAVMRPCLAPIVRPALEGPF
jgi:hypothetical protein